MNSGYNIKVNHEYKIQAFESFMPFLIQKPKKAYLGLPSVTVQDESVLIKHGFITKDTKCFFYENTFELEEIKSAVKSVWNRELGYYDDNQMFYYFGDIFNADDETKCNRIKKLNGNLVTEFKIDLAFIDLCGEYYSIPIKCSKIFLQKISRDADIIFTLCLRGRNKNKEVPKFLMESFFSNNENPKVPYNITYKKLRRKTERYVIEQINPIVNAFRNVGLSVINVAYYQDINEKGNLMQEMGLFHCKKIH